MRIPLGPLCTVTSENKFPRNVSLNFFREKGIDKARKKSYNEDRNTQKKRAVLQRGGKGESRCSVFLLYRPSLVPQEMAALPWRNRG